MRNSSIELYRCLLMVGICLLHSITQAGHKVTCVANALFWCVTGFAFISGWYGMRFSFKKVLRLYGISLYCSIVFVVIDSFFGCGGKTWKETAFDIWDIAIGHWFVNAYLLLMCFAPMVNVAVEMIKNRSCKERRRSLAEIVVPIVLCCFVWGFGTTLPVVRAYIPNSTGLTAYSFITLCGIYVVARTIRELGLPHKVVAFLRSKWAVGITVTSCLSFCAVGFNDYNSPFALVLACVIFLVLEKTTLPKWLGTIASFLGPSMFSVYLIHGHSRAWGVLTKVEEYFISHHCVFPLSWVLTALAVFVACCLLDMPRRFVALLIIAKK